MRGRNDDYTKLRIQPGLTDTGCACQTKGGPIIIAEARVMQLPATSKLEV